MVTTHWYAMANPAGKLHIRHYLCFVTFLIEPPKNPKIKVNGIDLESLDGHTIFCDIFHL